MELSSSLVSLLGVQVLIAVLFGDFHWGFRTVVVIDRRRDGRCDFV